MVVGRLRKPAPPAVIQAQNLGLTTMSVAMVRMRTVWSIPSRWARLTRPGSSGGGPDAPGGGGADASAAIAFVLG